MPQTRQLSTTMSKTIEEILAPKPEAQPRIYAYAIDDAAHAGLLKVGQTTRDVKQRVDEQVKTAAIKNLRIELDEPAGRDDGTFFTDHQVRTALVAKGIEKVELEWMRCAVADVQTVLTELRTGRRLTGTHHETFEMRAEQRMAVEKTHAYFHSVWQEDMHAVPRFLWNAKMRFGKTFATYQLARKLGAKRVLVVTFKPAVEDAWQTDLESHVDFDGWQYLSRHSDGDPRNVSRRKPVVYFGSFQDLLGRDAAGNIKPKNEWVHTMNWDLVVFDEYHFGAWRETAQELFEGEEEAVAKKEAKLEYATGLAEVNEDLSELSAEFLPITTKAYLYLSGTPFRALATGEFIEEQIFNWTYADEQRAKEEYAANNPGKWNPDGALPQLRLLTYQMPDELLAIASAGEFDEFDLNALFEASSAGEMAQFKHKDDVQKWLDIIGGYLPKAVEYLKTGTRPPFPYSDVRLLRICSTLSGFCPTSRRAMRWRTCWQRSTTPSGTTTRWSSLPASAGIGLDAPPCARPSGAVSRPRPLRYRAVSSPPRDGAAVVVDPDAPQPQVTRILLPGRVSRAVALVHQEPQRRQPERGGDPQARLLRVRLRADARAAAALGVRDRAGAERAEPGESGPGPRVVPAGAGLRRREHDAD